MSECLLVALNAKYIHSNLAVRYLKSYADEHLTAATCKILELTVNLPLEDIVCAIEESNADAVAFSCYIWNIDIIKACVPILRAHAPSLCVILGGPEVSYCPEKYLNDGFADYVLCGDGEKPMTALLEAHFGGKNIPENMGICTKGASSEPYVEHDLASLAFAYTDEYISSLPNRIAYIESTRGCPFSCAFCLSGDRCGVRYFPIEDTKRALDKLYKSGAKTIKFVDRTFNANEKHANEIISYIIKMTNGDTSVCFHFEIAADILRESTLELLTSAPKGLFQIEAGIQSFNERTLAAVNRKTNLEKVCETVARLASSANIHTHTDLIAGLPYEDLKSFRDSFNKAYSIGADMLQLGFLKVIHGSTLRVKADEYGLSFDDKPPYEVVGTPWLTDEDMRILKDAEDANDKIHNSMRFVRSLAYVLEVSDVTPFDLFADFGRRDPMPLDAYTALLYEYFASLPNVDKSRLRDLMCLDRLYTNKAGKLPPCLKIFDERLPRIKEILTAKYPVNAAVKRTVCILYSFDEAAVCDRSDEAFTLMRLPLEDLL